MKMESRDALKANRGNATRIPRPRRAAGNTVNKAESGSECRVRSRLETVSIQLVESIRVSLVLSEWQS